MFEFGAACVFLLFILFGYKIRSSGLANAFLYIIACGLSISSYHFLVYHLIMDKWYYPLLSIFIGMVAGYAIAAYMINKRNKTLGKNLTKTIDSLFTLDFRVIAILSGTLISCILTYYFAFLAKAVPATANDPAPFWVGFYPAWTAGLLFFALVGLILAMVTLYRPEKDVFAARVRILFGGNTGRAAQYVSGQLLKVGHYSPLTERWVTITDYDAARKAFKIHVRQVATVSNIYHDEVIHATGVVSVTGDDKFENPPAVLGVLESFRVNGEPQPDVPATLTVAPLRRSWQAKILGGETAQIEYEFWMWALSTEPHSFTPVRFTEVLKTNFNLRCEAPQAFEIEVAGLLGHDVWKKEFAYDRDVDLPVLRDLEPGTIAYKFYLREIEPAAASEAPEKQPITAPGPLAEPL